MRELNREREREREGGREGGKKAGREGGREEGMEGGGVALLPRRRRSGRVDICIVKCGRIYGRRYSNACTRMHTGDTDEDALH